MNMVTTWYEANVKDESMPKKFYQNVLNYESVKLMKRPISTKILMKVLRLTHIKLTMRWEIIYWAMMSSC